MADLTGFEPATSALTGRRALRAAPQVRGNGHPLLGPDNPAAEQPFTLARPGFGPPAGKSLVTGLWRGSAQGGHPGFEVRVPRLVEGVGERRSAEAVGDLLCLVVPLL